ncbi:hypothetical protein PCANC_05306 [Puccinia coronata f. sp. avenae]|uniref:Uncharacterized protein n=1 Tax=Puccinia coronata f. sp. avenae TaxID=200324 RepID=A0A2N5VYT6_9BASI|nr:hypothetical protein PCANC_05306 [Puccinia coronata f. sp. avenae]
MSGNDAGLPAKSSSKAPVTSSEAEECIRLELLHKHDENGAFEAFSNTVGLDNVRRYHDDLQEILKQIASCTADKTE